MRCSHSRAVDSGLRPGGVTELVGSLPKGRIPAARTAVESHKPFPPFTLQSVPIAMKHAAISLALLALAACTSLSLVTDAACGREYHVSPQGSDANYAAAHQLKMISLLPGWPNPATWSRSTRASTANASARRGEASPHETDPLEAARRRWKSTARRS